MRFSIAQLSARAQAGVFGRAWSFGFIGGGLPGLLSMKSALEVDRWPISDFWRWACSDLLANTRRGHLAAFIVVHALAFVATPRVEWEAVDPRTDSGIGVEVESSAYLQSW